MGVSEHECEHNFVFLRQIVSTVKQWGDRVLEREVRDVFFCSRCLLTGE